MKELEERKRRRRRSPFGGDAREAADQPAQKSSPIDLAVDVSLRTRAAVARVRDLLTPQGKKKRPSLPASHRGFGHRQHVLGRHVGEQSLVARAHDEARTQDVLETTTAGVAFETEYLGQALCGDLIVINTEWDCHGIEIRGEVDLFPVTGVVQAVSGQGIVNFAFSDTEEQWKLLSSTQDDADGVW